MLWTNKWCWNYEILLWETSFVLLKFCSKLNFGIAFKEFLIFCLNFWGIIFNSVYSSIKKKYSLHNEVEWSAGKHIDRIDFSWQIISTTIIFLQLCFKENIESSQQFYCHVASNDDYTEYCMQDLYVPWQSSRQYLSSELYMTRYFYIYVLTQTKNVFQIYIPNWYLNITNAQIGVNTGNVSYVSLMWSFIIVLILLSNDISHSFTSL